MNGVYKGLLTAALVGLLLVLAERFGKRRVGLITGAPTVSGPALLWTCLDQGPAFAGTAASGAVFGSIACAAFASAYMWSGRRCKAGRALAVATAAAIVGLAPIAWWTPGLAVAVLLSTLSVLVLHALAYAPRRPPTWADRRPMSGAASALVTAGVAGAVSAAVSAGAPSLGAFGCGLVASLPLIAGAVAVRLHAQEGIDAAGRFLHSYRAALIGRIAFSGAFGCAVLVLPLPAAFGLALVVSAVGFAAAPLIAALKRPIGARATRMC